MDQTSIADHESKINPNYKKPNPVRPPKEGRCQFYMPRKQRYCTVMVDTAAGIKYCHDHKLLVGNENAKEHDNTQARLANYGGEKRPRSPEGEEEANAISSAENDERMPCPYSTLHTIRKKNYWHHLSVCPHKSSPSTLYCTREDCNIMDPSVRRASRRQVFTDLSSEIQQSFLQWVEDKYAALHVEESIIVPPHTQPLELRRNIDPLSHSSEEAKNLHNDWSATGYVRPALKGYVANGKGREAAQHVALTNIAHLAFYTNFDKGASSTALNFPEVVVLPDAMKPLSDALSYSNDHAPSPSLTGGVIEYGAGKGGLIAAMRLAYPMLSTIVVDRDLFRDMKDTQLAKSERGQKGGQESTKDKDSLVSKQGIPHARIKMNIKDFDVDKCIHGIQNGSVALTTALQPPITLPSQWLAVGKHLCGGCTDMTLKSVVEAKETTFQGIMIATCCHHMCSPDTYVYPELFAGSSIPAMQTSLGGATDSLSLSPSTSVAELLLDCCCGIAGWAISGKDIDDRRRSLGRKAKRLLDYGRVQYLKGVQCRDGSGPLFRFVGMVQYTTTSTTEENEVMVAIR